MQAVAELKEAFPNYNLTELALRWILMFAAVSCVIPGARNADQAEANVAASSLPPLTAVEMANVERIYNSLIKPSVHGLW